MKEFEQVGKDCQLNENLVPKMFVLSHIITSQHNRSFL
jgi:hypothetical protein